MIFSEGIFPQTTFPEKVDLRKLICGILDKTFYEKYNLSKIGIYNERR